MKQFESIGAILSAWTGSVAAAMTAGFDRLVSPRVVRLIEDEEGGFAVEARGQGGQCAGADRLFGRRVLRAQSRALS